MAEITASMVKDLREKTGAGMMDCKNALNENQGDMEAAIDWLRKKGLSKAAKKAGRVAAEGLVALAVSPEGHAGALVEINSETDFVARNEAFQAMTRDIADLALGVEASVEALAEAAYPGVGASVRDHMTTMIATIGEHMSLRRVSALAVEPGVIAGYMHNQVAPGLGKIGVLVALESTGDKAKLEALGRQIAMHIAAVNPLSLSPADLDQALVERERAVLVEQAQASGKPAAVIEKMVDGRIRKYYEEVVLLAQAFVVNPDISVQQAVDALAKELGTPVSVKAFVRYALGEGIEKEKTDFAAEVAAAAGN
jgi:elongation factor Ts